MRTFPAPQRRRDEEPATEPMLPAVKRSESPFVEIKRRFGNSDLAAFAACRELARMPAPIGAAEMAEAILAGALDKDGRATPSELREFQRFSYSHPGKLTAEAAEVLAVYEHAMATALARGETAISASDYTKMCGEIGALSAGRAERALSGLDATPGWVTSGAMTKAILTGIRDREGNSTGHELQQFEAWVKKNLGRLSFGAQQVFAIYRRTAGSVLNRGQKAFTSTEFAYLAMRLRGVKTT